MNLGKITDIAKQEGGARVEATLPAPLPNDGARYLMEIVVERGPFLSIPNVSIIEEGDTHVVYLQKAAGQYVPQPIETGLQGELYTQVLHGLNEGDLVVSVGSFFVDAENKLKSPSAMMAAMSGMDHSAMPGMPGMDHSAMPGMDNRAVAANAAPGSPPSAAPGLVMTDPAPNANVKAPLMMIHVMFNTRVDPKTSGFDVTNDKGSKVDVGEAMLMGTDGKMLMAMPKTPLPAGRYKVKWHAVGADTKPLQGEFSFTVQ
jgi:methionine-rich copper-binding protein CopC